MYSDIREPPSLFFQSLYGANLPFSHPPPPSPYFDNWKLPWTEFPEHVPRTSWVFRILVHNSWLWKKLSFVLGSKMNEWMTEAPALLRVKTSGSTLVHLVALLSVISGAVIYFWPQPLDVCEHQHCEKLNEPSEYHTLRKGNYNLMGDPWPAPKPKIWAKHNQSSCHLSCSSLDASKRPSVSGSGIKSFCVQTSCLV